MGKHDDWQDEENERYNRRAERDAEREPRHRPRDVEAERELQRLRSLTIGSGESADTIESLAILRRAGLL